MDSTDRDTIRPFELRAVRLAEIHTLYAVADAFWRPHSLKVGDLVQMRRCLLPVDADADHAPTGIVLALIDNLGIITDAEEDKGLPGLRLARMAEDLTPEFTCDPAWWFEPYTGPRPDAH